MGKPINHVSASLNSLFIQMPEEQKSKILLFRHIKKVHQQYSELVSPLIVKHTNSVYLTKEGLDQEGNTFYKLVVYVDNSTIAAELNACRELVKIKYLDRFGLNISTFEIKISRGEYRKRHINEALKTTEVVKPRDLTPEEEAEIDQKVAGISNPTLRESFKKVLIAEKQRNENL